ncbi:hypothetical protein N656DRAFT_90570 [Canariomyces notabilis]|uniref:Uncharacterized protein n=1 Tax=Canariomyces notabilis TaxID=2074819 RepID=A0AAN6TDK3_9PEZI|nr:hypothetical protein N656DRAFT_90570 [Canariomyces arenarius]
MNHLHNMADATRLNEALIRSRRWRESVSAEQANRETRGVTVEGWCEPHLAGGSLQSPSPTKHLGQLSDRPVPCGYGLDWLRAKGSATGSRKSGIARIEACATFMFACFETLWNGRELGRCLLTGAAIPSLTRYHLRYGFRSWWVPAHPATSDPGKPQQNVAIW